MGRRVALMTAILLAAVPGAPAGAQVCERPATPATTIYLPNVTKSLLPDGWVTPFIVQNVSSTTATSLRIEFYRFSDGSLVAARDVCVLAPRQSYADVPDNDADLPGNTQFSVVVKSYMTDAVAIVNEQAGSGGASQAAAYAGVSRGSTSVSLPNIVKRFFQFRTPFIIQNVGTATTTATASFVSFDGTHTAAIARTMAPGRSQFIDPDAEPTLRDGTQYAVTVAASQPIAVVVNTHGFAAPSPTSIAGGPVAYATTGIAEGTNPVLLPYTVKNVAGVGKGLSTIVVQNLGSMTTPTLTFRPLGATATTQFVGPALATGRSWAFDPRFVDGSTANGVCGSAATLGCLADGEYSAVASAENDAIAAVVNVIGSSSATGYSGILNGGARAFLPNVTRTLGGSSFWTTPIVVQGNTATAATLSWYRFSDGALVRTQIVTLGTGVSQWVDPRTVSGLADDAQFSVVVDGVGGTLGAIVVELSFQGGDGAMTYEGFLR